MLEIAPEVENSLHIYAQHEGVSVNELIARAFPPLAIPYNPVAQVQALVAKWQALDSTRIAEPAANEGNLTPSGTLFREWEQEDAQLSPEELDAEAESWEAFKQSINVERANSGMRLIF